MQHAADRLRRLTLGERAHGRSDHGGVNRVLLNHMMNLPWQGTVSIEQDACCINIVDVDMDGARVVRYLVRGVNITGYNLSKRGIGLTDMERAAQRIAAAAKR